MNPNCARCGKIVYPTEKVNCLDKFWHKACFHCETCKMTLNMKNYKGYEKTPYCNAHYPKQSFTMVADTPENLRLKQQSELQSQVRYKEEFEKNKGKGFSVVADTPELQRIKKTQDQISNVCSLACCGTPTASRPPAHLGDSCHEGRKGLGFPLAFFLCTPIFPHPTLGPHGTSTGKALSFCTGRACVLKLSPPSLKCPPTAAMVGVRVQTDCLSEHKGHNWVAG